MPAYVSSKAASRRSAGSIDRDVTGEAAVTWDAHAAFLAQRSDFFANLLAGATPLWDKPVAVAAIPYGFLRREVISDAVYPLGDQLVVIPSYTGDGTSIALHTGIAAAHAVLDGQSAGEFQAKTIAKLKPQIAWAKVANVAFVNATAQRVTSAVARVAPWAVAGDRQVRGEQDARLTTSSTFTLCGTPPHSGTESTI